MLPPGPSPRGSEFNGQACSLGISEWGGQVENPQAKQRCSSWANWGVGGGGSLSGVSLCQGSKRTSEEKVQGCGP